MKKQSIGRPGKQAPSVPQQRQLRLAAVIRQNLYEFVVQEGMKALDALLEQDRTSCAARSTAREAITRPCVGGARTVGS